VTDSLKEHWIRIRASLAVAEGQLMMSDPDLSLYREFVQANELGLALDELVRAAAEVRASNEVWTELSRAAMAMHLEPSDVTHGPTVQRIRDHLAAAHKWRGLRRLLNEWDPIGVFPHLGGPDDEYDCLYGPLMDHLHAGAPAQQIAAYLRSELTDHFGIDPTHANVEQFAERLSSWFASGAPA
jgi:hypothetical protein